jgi:hypothetical protein
VVKRRHGLDRCHYKGDAGMKRWVGLGASSPTTSSTTVAQWKNNPSSRRLNPSQLGRPLTPAGFVLRQPTDLNPGNVNFAPESSYAARAARTSAFGGGRAAMFGLVP